MGFLLHDVSRLRRTALDRALRNIGVTRSQWWVLAILYHYRCTPLTQSELETTLNISCAALGRLLNRLVIAELVERRYSDYDQHVKRVVLTPRGLDRTMKIQHLVTRANSRIMAGLSATDVQCVEKVLIDIKLRLLAILATHRSEHANCQSRQVAT